MSRLVVKNGRVVDPSQRVDRICDVAIEDGTIREIAEGIEAAGAETFDASGLVVAPGFIDACTSAGAGIRACRDD